MWVSVLADKRLYRREKSSIFRCCMSPAQKGVGLFSHAKDNIYISPQLCKDFLVPARFSPLCHFPFIWASQIHTA